MINTDLPELGPDAEARVAEALRRGQDLVAAARTDGNEVWRNARESAIGNDSEHLVWASNHASSLLIDGENRALIPYFDVMTYENFLLTPLTSEFESLLGKLAVKAAHEFPGDTAYLAAKKREWISRALGRSTVQNAAIEQNNRIYWSDVETQFRAFEWPHLYGIVRTGWWSIGGLPHETAAQEAFKDRFVFTVNRALNILGFADSSVWVAIAVWMDLIHTKSPHASNRCINNLCTASAEFCAELGACSTGKGHAGAIGKTPRLNLALIEKWITDEGYTNKELAGQLNTSERVVSSIRNEGKYHGRDALTKLANLMNRDVDDLYKS